MSNTGKTIAALFGIAGLSGSALLVQEGYATWWVALLLGLAWQAVIGLSAVVASVAQQAVKRRVEQIVDALDDALGRRVSRFARYYRRYVLERDGHINTRDLAYTPARIPELDAVYVDVGLAPGSPSPKSGGLVPTNSGEPAARQSIHDFLDTEQGTVCAIIGAPGSGKSTLMRHTARRVASQGKDRRRRVPVLIALRDHAGAFEEPTPPSLANLIRDDIGELDVAEPSGWWESQLREGNCVVLLDGLDEVATSAGRIAATRWIEDQIARHPRNDYLVTSRPHGYRTAAISKAAVLQVRPFTTEQIRTFTHSWYRAAERLGTQAEGPQIDRRAADDADDFLRQLAGAPALQDFAANPLLLTMMVLVRRERRVLPEGRSDLYREVCDVMLWRRQESKRLEVNPSGAVRLRIIAELAFAMMVKRVSDLSRSEVLDIFEAALEALDNPVSPDTLLTEIVESSGLLIEREKGLFSFAHHTLGEYLAATHIRGRESSAVLAGTVGDPWWRETTLLYVADTDADRIIQACLDRNTGTSLALAFDCVRHHAHIHRALRRELDRVRAKAFEDVAAPEQRWPVANAIATTHFSEFIPVADGALLCPLPVPEELYWLFCKDTATALPDGTSGPAPDPDLAATGMTKDAAQTFVAWLNMLGGDESVARYRLPTRLELESARGDSSWQSAQEALVFWTDDHPLGRGDAPWTATDLNPYMLSSHQIIEEVTRDLHGTAFHAASLLNSVYEAAHDLQRLVSASPYGVLPAQFAQPAVFAIPSAVQMIVDLLELRDIAATLDGFKDFEYDPVIRAATDLRDHLALYTDYGVLRMRAFEVSRQLAEAWAFAPRNRTSFYRAATQREGRIGWFGAGSADGPESDYIDDLLGRVLVTEGRPLPLAADLLVQSAGIASGGEYRVDLASAGDRLTSLASKLRNTVKTSPEARLNDEAAQELKTMALPVLKREHRPSSSESARIRLISLALAASLRQEGNPPLAKELHAVVAAITWCDLRARRAIPMEAIVLARE